MVVVLCDPGTSSAWSAAHRNLSVLAETWRGPGAVSCGAESSAGLVLVTARALPVAGDLSRAARRYTHDSKNGRAWHAKRSDFSKREVFFPKHLRYGCLQSYFHVRCFVTAMWEPAWGLPLSFSPVHPVMGTKAEAA